ncbi:MULTISPECIES: ABC transporter family substrate-binding protein [unclassified Brevibacterium]|uniref:ABC transporter family substrate-binding protein n=1 Tax=unclassified Brevibacterium TaxID=2614124 RepID=UPI001E33A157|nr:MULTISPECIES: ABC transporter family substrate-binding protein [unclassified Brevibacterium]MCD1284582.1 ABC transporter substrate-binding protein [Brevibacterium sp. CCUG 69071]MDK8435801.1 ABC transporter family substrate-binding protein [Brevibacterium sp. H-BE7]
MKKRFLAAGASVAAAAMVLTACTPPGGGDDEQSSDNSAVNIGWNESFRSMNTLTANGNAVSNAILTYMMNDNFGYYDGDLEVQDGALGKVEQVSEDPLKVKYTFNDDAKWSDGTPVDAADLALTWAGTSSNFNTVESNNDDEGAVKENDEKTVYFDSSTAGSALIKDFPEISDDGKEITLEYSKPYADWQTEFGTGADGVGVPAHIVAKKALGVDDAAEGKQAILDAIKDKDTEKLSKISNTWNTGFDFTSMPEDEDLLVHSGPYKMTKFEEGQYVTLELDDNYSGPVKPKVQTVTVRYNGDPMAMIQAVENGEVDMTQPQATADVLSAAEDLDGVTVDSADGATYEHVDFTFDNKGPFDPEANGGDEEKAKKVRQAFLKTLPREDIVEKIIKPLNDQAVTRDSYSQVPGSPMYDAITGANGVVDATTVDVDAAKKLLEEAGADAPTVRVMYDNTNARRQQEFQLIKESAEKAGFKIEDVGDVNWGTRLGDGTYDVSLFGWQSEGTGVTENDANFRTGAQNNYGGYSNPDMDKLLDELLVSKEDEHEELLTDMEKMLSEDAFGAPIFQFPELTIYRDKVKNVKSTAVSPTMFWNYWEWETN